MSGKELCERWGSYYRKELGFPENDPWPYDKFTEGQQIAWDKLAEDVTWQSVTIQ